MKSLQDMSVQYIKGVGPAKKKLFSSLGIENVEDLFYFFPRRYEDRTKLTSIAEVQIGEWYTVSGKIAARSARRSWHTKKHVSEITVDDGSGRLTCTWFNRPYLENYLKAGNKVVLFGKVDQYKKRLQMVSPEYEVISSAEDESLSMGRIVPVYSLTKGLTQRYLRKVINNCLGKHLEALDDVLPVPLRNKHRLANIKRSIRNIHFPDSLKEQESALKRISFEEFFFFQVSVTLRRLSITHKNGIGHKIDEDFIQQFCEAFPFSLTGAQQRVINEIAGDMQKPNPMLRLLQGDVGSGKTLIAIFGSVAAYRSGQQSAIMAPTEILARQHFNSIKDLIAGGPFKDMNIALLVSNLKKKEREAINGRLKRGEIDLIIGTHALLSEEVDFKNLSFVVIDEQHKFGVRQRAFLSAKGTNPDILVMTATPIPRTLCMTLYGDLDVSIIDEMPPGRGVVHTKVYNEEQMPEVYVKIRERVAKGQQAYIIYPIIDESDTLDLKAAQKMFEHFRKKEFKNFRIGLVHGQMNREDAQASMEKFKNKKIDILVATTVLEVGVDVPNANIMVIEHAERFGLSQLHQLRGRIGRGKEDALCILIANPLSEDGKARIKAIMSSNNGFKIAEADLLIRGPGHYFGRHQHGLNELKVANPMTQIDILEVARKEAIELTREDPGLKEKPHSRIKEIIQERYPTYLREVEAG